jgi:hypothetical protein
MEIAIVNNGETAKSLFFVGLMLLLVALAFLIVSAYKLGRRPYSPAVKLLWIVFVTIVPILGPILFMLVSRNPPIPTLPGQSVAIH